MLADSERKLAKAMTVGADALVLDLVDVVLPDRKPAAPLGIVLPKIHGPEDMERSRTTWTWPRPTTASCTQTPSAVLRMGELIGRNPPHLRGMLFRRIMQAGRRRQASSDGRSTGFSADP